METFTKAVILQNSQSLPIARAFQKKKLFFFKLSIDLQTFCTDKH